MWLISQMLIAITGVVKSPLAGNFVSNQIRLIFQQAQPPIQLTPHYMVTSKTPVEAGVPAQAVYKKFEEEPTASFRRLEEERVLTEFKESVVQVWSGGKFSGNAEEVYNNSPGRPFEMPDGWNQVFRAERFKAVEGLFDAKAALTVGPFFFLSSGVVRAVLSDFLLTPVSPGCGQPKAAG